MSLITHSLHGCVMRTGESKRLALPLYLYLTNFYFEYSFVSFLYFDVAWHVVVAPSFLFLFFHSGTKLGTS